MKHWNDHSIVKSGSSAECHTFSVNRGLVNTYDVIDVKSVVDGMLFNVACLVLKHDDTQLANQYVKQLSAFTRNTKARYEQGKKLDPVYSGSVYRLPETEECE